MEGLPASRTRKGSKHDKTGCLTCRSRRKKCSDKTHPVCGTCARLNLACIWEHQCRLPPSSNQRLDQLSQNSAAHSHTTSVPLPLRSKLAQQLDGTRRPANRLFLEYYIEFLAKMLTTSLQHNSFSAIFIPMAIESPVLLHALIAFASANMSYFDASYEAMAIEARVKALSYLSASILDSDMAQREMNLAACLVLSTAEISLGHRKEWHSHLQGAKHVIVSSFVSGHDSQLTSASEALKGTHEGRWLLRNFAYHDIMASVLSGQLLMHPDYLEGITTTIDSYFGVALDPLIYVAQISSLDLTQLKDAVARPFDLDLGIIETTWPLVTKIESNLRSWQCPHVRDSALMSMGRSFRNAALLYLYGRIHDVAPLCESLSNSTTSRKSTIHDRVEAEVTKTLHHLSNIPLNGCAEGSLLFPLFLAGIATSRNVNMVTISRRIKHIVEKRGFRNFQLGLEALERIWASKSYHRGTAFGGLEWEAIQQLAGSGVTLS